MFGPADDLTFYLLLLGIGTAVLSAVLSWVAARRYGRWRALTVPLLALAALGFVVWRAGFVGAGDAMSTAIAAVAIASPAVAGGLLGLAFAARRRN